MQKVFNVVVDIGRKLPAPAFEVNTNDLKSVKLLITITNGQTQLDLTDTTVRIAIRKPDNNILFQDCTIKDAKTGQVEIVLENQAYIMAGTHTAEIMCYKGSDVVAVSGTFSYKSTKGILNDEAVESKSEFTTITGMLKDVQDTIKDFRENGTGIDAKARADIEKNTAQLAEKANKNELQSLVINKAEKSYVDQQINGLGQLKFEGQYDTFSLLKTAKPNGATGFYLVVADGHLYRWNGTDWIKGALFQPTGIGDKSVTYEKVDFLETGKNLFNPLSNTKTGFVVDLVKGDLVPSSGGNSSSDYIEVEPNTTYVKNFSDIITVAFYNTNKVFLSGVSGISFTTPADCRYVKINFKEANKNSTQLEKGSVATKFEPFGHKLKNTLPEPPITTERYEDKSLTIEKTDFVTIGKNLFNKDNFTADHVVESTTGALSPSTSGTFTSDYIKVMPNTNYIKSNTGRDQVAFYDVNKKYISGIVSSGFKTPTNCVYVRFSFLGTQKDRVQLEEGTTATPYEPFVYKFKYHAENTGNSVSESAYLGVRYSLTSTSALCERVDGITDQSKLDNLYPFNNIRLCNVKKTEWGATLITYSDETGFARDGSNGDVMAEIPKHYFKRYQKDGYEYVLISGTHLDGYQLEPAFIENGKELNAIYVGVYDGYVDAENKLRSISGVQPTTNVNLNTFRTRAKANGEGFALFDARSVLMLQRLFMVYYANRNSQEQVGMGLVEFPWQSWKECKAVTSVTASNQITVDARGSHRYFRIGMLVAVSQTYSLVEQRKITAMETTAEGYTKITFTGDPVDIVAGKTEIYSQAQLTGLTDKVTTKNGMSNVFGGFNGTEAVKWLHIENLWGNVWNLLDGVYINNLVVYAAKNINDYTDANNFRTSYKPLALKVPLQNTNNQDAYEEANYYVRNLMLDKINPSYAFPGELGNGSNRNAGFADPFYASSDGAYIPSYGGGIDHIYRAGLFVWRFSYRDTSAMGILCGARLIYKPL